jgi:hypothetical protein
MNRFLSVGVAGVCALLLGTFTHAASQEAESKAGGKITMTGCLEKGADANTFKLTNIAEGAGAAAKTAEAMKPDWELVDAPASLKLSEHVGHKVTVTGTKVGAGEAEKMKGETGTMAKAGEAMGRHLKVTSIKHVAATCP